MITHSGNTPIVQKQTVYNCYKGHVWYQEIGSWSSLSLGLCDPWYQLPVLYLDPIQSLSLVLQTGAMRCLEEICLSARCGDPVLSWGASAQAAKRQTFLGNGTVLLLPDLGTPTPALGTPTPALCPSVAFLGLGPLTQWTLPGLLALCPQWLSPWQGSEPPPGFSSLRAWARCTWNSWHPWRAPGCPSLPIPSYPPGSPLLVECQRGLAGKGGMHLPFWGWVPPRLTVTGGLTWQGQALPLLGCKPGTERWWRAEPATWCLAIWGLPFCPYVCAIVPLLVLTGMVPVCLCEDVSKGQRSFGRGLVVKHFSQSPSLMWFLYPPAGSCQ